MIDAAWAGRHESLRRGQIDERLSKRLRYIVSKLHWDVSEHSEVQVPKKKDLHLDTVEDGRERGGWCEEGRRSSLTCPADQLFGFQSHPSPAHALARHPSLPSSSGSLRVSTPATSQYGLCQQHQADAEICHPGQHFVLAKRPARPTTTLEA